MNETDFVKHIQTRAMCVMNTSLGDSGASMVDLLGDSQFKHAVMWTSRSGDKRLFGDERLFFHLRLMVKPTVELENVMMFFVNLAHMEKEGGEMEVLSNLSFQVLHTDGRVITVHLTNVASPVFECVIFESKKS